MAECKPVSVGEENSAVGFSIMYCKTCNFTCEESSKCTRCQKCQSPVYWTCAICEKELMAQSRGDHIKSCSHEKMLKRQIARAKLAEDKKKWKRAIVPSDAGSATKRSKNSESSNDSEVEISSPVQMRDPSSPSKKAGLVIPSCPTSFVAKVKCLYSYSAMRPDEIGFKEGEVISVVEKRPSGWWIGYVNGRCGLFPSNYTSEITMECNGASPPLPSSARSTDGDPTPAENGGNAAAVPNAAQTTDILHTLKRLNDGKAKSLSSAANGNGAATHTQQHYEELVKQLLLELEQQKQKCQEQDEKIQKLEKEKRDSIKELIYVKAVLESSLNYKAEEEDALAGLEALQTLNSLF